MITRLSQVVETVRNLVALEILLRFDDHELNAKVATGVGSRILPSLTIGGLYVGLTTVVAVHFVVLESAYHVVAYGRLFDGVTRSLFRIDSLRVPNTLVQWVVLTGCGLASGAVHELGHVLALADRRVRIHGVGVELVLGVPLRFFTRYDRNEWNNLTPREQASVQSAGIAANHLLAVVALVVFLQFGLQAAGWLYALSVALAVLSAIPLTLADGNELLHYLLLGGSEPSGDETANTFGYVVGFASWLLVAGSLLAIGLTTTIRFATG